MFSRLEIKALRESLENSSHHVCCLSLDHIIFAIPYLLSKVCLFAIVRNCNAKDTLSVVARWTVQML